MRRQRAVLVVCLALLTLAQIYALYAILWFGWLTATPISHPEIARLYAERWELATIPIGLLWIICAIALFCTRKRA